ncbi:DUF4350 domain-containing protein [Microbacterium cremeum]|uniref:DUF4350 domain-containing protein n=1 Tax=Microbacterium cremeum TaxID=2782169 RepID=UPI00188903F7|nr:DUF4350 domain-containing protein [Microbacterium cremeum]
MTAATTPREAPTTVLSPRRGRRVATWIVIGLALLAIGGIGAAMSTANQWASRGALDPASAGPSGTRALAEVLRDHGVEVVVARDRQTATEALRAAPATLVLPDAPALSDDAVAQLASAAADVVLIEPRARTLDLLLDGSEPAGAASVEAVDPACALPDARRAGPIAPGAVYAAGVEVIGCYPSGDAYGLLTAGHSGGGRVAAVDGRALFTNEHLAEEGNAALGVNLLGRHPVVVWYVPSPGDSDLADADPSLGELTPPWVSPVIVLLLVAGIAAGIWRGRRFGPLVAERLPVTVRASETTEGRARLYARARDPLHAADQLRIGTLRRLARLLGLGPASSAPEIADAVAGRTGLDRGAVRGILFDDDPRSDADLVALTTSLRHLEDAVHAAVRPSTSSAPGTSSGTERTP